MHLVPSRSKIEQKRSDFRSNVGSFAGSIYVITKPASIVSRPIHPRGLFKALVPDDLRARLSTANNVLAAFHLPDRKAPMLL
jgi:hypothetical protein